MEALVRFFPLEATAALDLRSEGVSSFAKVYSSKDLHLSFSIGAAYSFTFFDNFLVGLHASSSSNTLMVEDFFVGLYAESSSDNSEQTDGGRQGTTYLEISLDY